jgi:hypothetical protein
VFTARVEFVRRHFSGSLLLAVLAAATLSMSSSAVVAQQPEAVLYKADAFGTTASVGKTITIGQTAPVIVPICQTANVPFTLTGTLASLSAPPLVSTGVVNTSAADTTGMATASADVHAISLLVGLISADEVKSVSTTTVDSNSKLETSATGSTFVNLNVAGQIINGLPAPNTTIDLAGLGKIVLNEHMKSNNGTQAHLSVNMIHVYITVANLLFPVGTEVTIAHAGSGITLISAPGALDGAAFGTEVMGNPLQSSKTAPVCVPGPGTDGIVKTKTLTGLNLPLILTSGTVVDSAVGNVTATDSDSQTSSTIQGLNLLSGLVTADVVYAQSNASTNDGLKFNFSTSGVFTNIFVAGHPEITGNVPKNTKVSIANLGTLYLNRVIRTKNEIKNVMIELTVDQDNLFGLPIGLDVKIGYAEASLHSTANP